MPKGGKQRLREQLSSVLYVKAHRLEIQKVWWWCVCVCAMDLYFLRVCRGDADAGVAASEHQCKALESWGPEDTIHWVDHEGSKGG